MASCAFLTARRASYLKGPPSIKLPRVGRLHLHYGPTRSCRTTPRTQPNFCAYGVQWYPFLFLPRQVPICSKAQGHILSGRYRAYPQYPHPHHLHLPIVQVDGAVIFSDPKDSLGPPGLQKSWLDRVLEERPNTTE